MRIENLPVAAARSRSPWHGHGTQPVTRTAGARSRRMARRRRMKCSSTARTRRPVDGVHPGDRELSTWDPVTVTGRRETRGARRLAPRASRVRVPLRPLPTSKAGLSHAPRPLLSERRPSLSAVTKRFAGSSIMERVLPRLGQAREPDGCSPSEASGDDDSLARRPAPPAGPVK